MAKIIKYSIEKDNDDTVIRLENGGIVCVHHNQIHLVSEYYHDRDVNKIPDWEKLSEGKMSGRDWENKQEVDQEVIDDALNWMFPFNSEFVFAETSNIF